MMAKGLGPWNGTSPGQHFVEHHAQRVDVAAGVAALGFHLLGRNVVRACPWPAVSLAKVSRRDALGAGDAEIDELHVVLRIDHDVFRLQIAVHHALAVDVLRARRRCPG